MKRFVIAILSLALVTQAWAQVKTMTPHDCLGATAASPVSITSGSSSNGNEVKPLGASSDMSGFVTFSGVGTLTVTVQTRRVNSPTWHTPYTGGTCMLGVSAGSHHFAVTIPACDVFRLVYTAAGGTATITDAFALDQRFTK